MISSSSCAPATRRRRRCPRRRSTMCSTRIAAGERPDRLAVARVFPAITGDRGSRGGRSVRGRLDRRPPPRCRLSRSVGGPQQPPPRTQRRSDVRSLAGEAMGGSLHTSVLTFGPGGTGVIAWTQYRKPGTVHPTAWLATTSDGGWSWSVQRQSFSLSSSPVFDGSRDGWTSGVDSHRVLRFYVTHDGGRSWVPAPSAAATEGTRGGVSVADGIVWAVGTGSCAGSRCKWVVMRGPASGDRLPATASQPLPPTNQNATTISAASATTAYVTAPARLGSDIYVTDDGGRDWRRIASPLRGWAHHVRSHGHGRRRAVAGLQPRQQLRRPAHDQSWRHLEQCAAPVRAGVLVRTGQHPGRVGGGCPRDDLPDCERRCQLAAGLARRRPARTIHPGF